LNEKSFKVSVKATSQGHEIGIFPITLNPSLVSRFAPLDRFSKEHFYVQLIHGDAVISTPDTAGPAGTSGELLPEPWHNLGSSEKCPIQGLYKPGHVLTLQGHFEFDAFATTELCKKFARQFGWSQQVLDTHLENIWRSAGPGRHEFAEALVLFFAGEDHIDEQ
jgi:GMP synthase-like glutamine amidotransferase